MQKEEDLKKDEEYAIRPQTKEEIGRQEESECPEYIIKVDLNEDQIQRLTKQAKSAFEKLKAEREAEGLPQVWQEADNQYDGNTSTNTKLLFNIHVPQSKIKTDAIVRAINEAFLDSDPIADVSPRPELAERQDGFVVCEKQAEFIDYAMDEEIKPAFSLTKIAYSAVKKFVGIGKICWSFRREQRRREESYEGKNEVVGVGQQGEPIVDNEGLRLFLQAYPDAGDKYSTYIKKLQEEKKISIVVKYKDTVKNNAELKYVKIENFYVRNGCNYNEGLKTEHDIFERDTYTYWELKRKEENKELINVDRLFMSDKTEDSGGVDADAENKEYNILEYTTYLKLEEKDKEPIKIKCWFSEDSFTFHGAEMFHYYSLDTDYLAFYVKLNDYGFYGKGLSVQNDLKNSNIAHNALVSLALHGIYVRSMMTPIVQQGSEVERLFLENKLSPTKPIPVDAIGDDVTKAIGFVNWPAQDTGSMIAMTNLLSQHDSSVSGVNEGMSGRESPTDPSAPAAKTIALLQASGVNIKDYIRTFLPSFNDLMSAILQLYYQMSQEGRKYKIRRKAMNVVGNNPFETISRDEMIAKTSVQARASAFAFDKNNEKIEATAAYTLVRNDPYAAQQPEVQYKALKTLLSIYGAKWKTLAENTLKSPEEFAQQQKNVAMEAITAILKNAEQYKKDTGVNPEIGLEKIVQDVTTAQAEAYSPTEGEQNAG